MIVVICFVWVSFVMIDCCQVRGSLHLKVCVSFCFYLYLDWIDVVGVGVVRLVLAVEYVSVEFVVESLVLVLVVLVDPVRLVLVDRCALM